MICDQVNEKYQVRDNQIREFFFFILSLSLTHTHARTHTNSFSQSLRSNQIADDKEGPCEERGKENLCCTVYIVLIFFGFV